jgi:hypothetical protein
VKRALLVLAVVIVASAPCGRPVCAQTEDAQALLEQGRRLYADLDYQEAESALTRALATPGLPDAFRVQVLETLGFVQVVEDQEPAARNSFERLFEIDPYYVVREPSGSPRVAEIVEAVRARAVPDAAIDPDARIRVELPSTARASAPTEVRLAVSSPAIVQLVIRVRGDHDVAWQAQEVEVAGGSVLAALAPHADATELELYVEGRDARGQLVTREGSALSPLRLPVRADPAGGGGGGGSILEQWWFWTLVGVVVVGTAVGVGVGVGTAGTTQAPMGTLPPGRVVLP